MTVPPGGPVVTSNGAYPTFNYHVNGFGGVLHTVDYRDDHEDLDALAAKACQTVSRLVYLSNPDNPMGTRHTPTRWPRSGARCPRRRCWCWTRPIPSSRPPGTNPPFDPVGPRGRPPAHLLQDLRAGGPARRLRDRASGRGDGLNKIRNHFGVNRVAQQAALAALEDQAYIDGVKRRSRPASRPTPRSPGATASRRCRPTPTFVAIDVGGAERGERLLKALQDRRVFIRKPGVPPLDRCIRVTVGPEGRARDLRPSVRRGGQGGGVKRSPRSASANGCSGATPFRGAGPSLTP